MAAKRKTAAKAKRGAPVKREDKARISKFLDNAMKQFEKRLESEDIKPTLGDYLKLMQIEKELDRDEAKEIKVTWVDQEESES
jgi:hypothetical protein